MSIDVITGDKRHNFAIPAIEEKPFSRLLVDQLNLELFWYELLIIHQVRSTLIHVNSVLCCVCVQQ